MNSDQTKDTLARIFREKKKRIVFWYDAEKEFDDMLSSIQLDDVTILRLENRLHAFERTAISKKPEELIRHEVDALQVVDCL